MHGALAQSIVCAFVFNAPVNVPPVQVAASVGVLEALMVLHLAAVAVISGVVAALVVEALLSPAALITVILNTYGVPLFNPVTVLVTAVVPVFATATVQVVPPSALCSIL